MPNTPSEPVITVLSPSPNAAVGFNQPFQVTGQVTDRGMPEPISIDSVTVQVDGGPLIRAALTIVKNKTLTQVNFHATAQVSGGNDPHTITVVATNDQPQSSTKTVTVFAGAPFQVDSPALVLDVLSLIPLSANDPQVLALLGKMAQQLTPLAATLTAAGKMLIGPNLVVQPVNSAESRLRLGFWIEDPTFPVVPPSAGFPLPRLSDTAAAAAFATVPLLTVSNPGLFPSYGLSIPVATLQHLVDAMTPAIKAKSSSQGLSIDSIKVQTSNSNTVTTNVNGHTLELVPANFSITETVGLAAVPDAPSPQSVPTVTSTAHSSSVGGLLDWFVGSLLPFVDDLLAYVLYKLSSAVDQKPGLAAPLLAEIPSRIPFGSKAFTLPSSVPFKLPDFPTLVFYWSGFGATSDGLWGAGNLAIESRTESVVKLSIGGANFFSGNQNLIVELTDPTFEVTLENLAPDTGKLGWQITGPRPSKGTIDAVSPLAQAGYFTASFELPLHVAPGEYPYNLTVDASEACESDPTKILSGATSRAVTFKVTPNLR